MECWGPVGRALVLLLERGVDVAVAHDVAGAACRHLVDVHVEAALLVPGQQAVVVVHLGTLGLVMVTHVAAAPSRLSEGRKVHRITPSMKGKLLNLQALLHPECLGVVIHIDNVFPHALRCLAPLGLGVFDLRGTEEAALLGKVPVLVRVILLSPGAEIVAVVISQLLV